jgi:hypothetical protein
MQLGLGSAALGRIDSAVVVPFRPLVLGAVAIGCQSLVGIEDSPPLRSEAGSGGGSGGAAAAGSSGIDASVTGGSAGVGAAGASGAPDAGCVSARPPAPPTGSPPGGDLDLVIAIRDVDFGDRTEGEPSWKKLGYDLDKLCTCDPDPAGPCKSPDPLKVCDGPGGRDNVIGALLWELRNTFRITAVRSDEFSGQIENGARTVLIRISDYNGEADDVQVAVAWYSTDRFRSANPDAGAPAWDGNDEWPVLAAALEPLTGADGSLDYSLDRPKFQDRFAFVSGGWMVAKLPEGLLALSEEIQVQFSGALLSGRLERDAGGPWRLEDGSLAGVAKVGEVLAVLALTNDPIFKQPLCTNNPMYEGVKTLICERSDMTLLDINPNAPCDYLSLGIGMRGAAARLGEIHVKPQAPSPCADAVDPAKDSCQPP